VAILNKGDDQNAEIILREVVAIQREQLGELGDNHSGVAVPMGHLAMTLVSQGNYMEGEHLYQEAIAIHPGLLTEGGPQRAETRSVYGVLMTQVGRYEEAEPHLIGGLETLTRRLGLGDDGDDRTQRAVSRLVDLYEAWGQARQGRRVPRHARALKIR
jgi:hypothetical protein